MPVCESSQIELRRKFLSDAFHTLNQPLTGLHCGLEIALQKPRGVGEYRQRIADGVENAGVILRLMRAVRDLVEATDPGERYGTVSLGLLLSQLQSELEVVAATTRVGLEIDSDITAPVLADPGKLLTALGGLIAAKMESHQPGGAVAVRAEVDVKRVVLAVRGTGGHKSQEIGDGSHGLAEIRRNAAWSYLWTLGAECEETEDGMVIRMPLKKS